MIMKKITIDGKEVYVQITVEEAIKSAKNNETLFFESDTEKELFYQSLDDKKEPDLDESDKRYKIIDMLPFLEDEDLNEIVDRILNYEVDVKDLPMEDMLPFLPEKSLDRLFLEASTNESIKVDLE